MLNLMVCKGSTEIEVLDFHRDKASKEKRHFKEERAEIFK